MSWQDGRCNAGSVPRSGPGHGSDIRGEVPSSLYHALPQYQCQVQCQHQEPWHTPYPAPSSTTHGNQPQPLYALDAASPRSVQPLPPYTASRIPSASRPPSIPSASRPPSIPSVSRPPVMSSSRISIVPPPRASATNSAPITASALSPAPYTTSNEKPRKRKRAEKTESKEKHVNPATPSSRVNRLPRGTQNNPFEIDSSPEPDTKAFVHKTPIVTKHSSSAGTRPDGLVTKGLDPYGSTFGNLSTSRVDLTSPLVQAEPFSGSKKQHGAQTDAFNYNHENHMVSPNMAYRQSNGYGPAPNVRASSYAQDGFQMASFGHNNDIPIPSAYYAPPQEQFSELRKYPSLPLAHTLSVPPQLSMAAPTPTAPVQGSSINDSEPVLSAEQQKVVDLILMGNNVFYTGSAGCGKSTILKAFVKRFEAQVPRKNVRIIAPTNLAALNVQGQTSWNYAGWTPDSFKKPLAALKKAASGQQVYERFDKTDVLVIDEISMVENHHFERLSEIMKASLGLKNGGGPFGGVQIIVTGDFCQLSPVKPFRYCIGCGWELIPDNPRGPRTYQCENRRCHEDVFEDIDKTAILNMST
ncbi:hypothetical protein IQ07DRAFT_21798 [Pyrenochaeta sp. DS3sAY3a]|nr:hypothetical protein IQ07DRAFT_21798 [Pyrenochaeta sp. DS3sAY3a]